MDWESCAPYIARPGDSLLSRLRSKLPVLVSYLRRPGIGFGHSERPKMLIRSFVRSFVIPPLIVVSAFVIGAIDVDVGVLLSKHESN